MTGHWLDVVGIGADGAKGLGDELRALIEGAHLVVGGRRHLAMVDGLGAGERVAWSSPMDATFERLVAQRGRPPAVVLASGDPLWFGISRLLLQRFNVSELRFHPTVSALQLAAARLGWPLADCLCLSLHGRPLASLARHLAPGRRLLVLTADGASPAAIGEFLAGAGHGHATLTVLEHLGGPDEHRVSFRADEAAARRFADLNTLGIELDAGAVAGHGVSQGLPDDAYIHDGQLTKQDMRAITLAHLAPRPGERLWDIGAGAGSIAIEWLLAGRSCPDRPLTAVAVEARPERLAMLIENAHRLGVPELEVIEGKAPDVLPEGPAPHAIFIGGGVAEPSLIDLCLDRLAVGGRLVVNAVTLGGEARLLDLRRRHGGELARIAISHAEGLGRTLGWKAKAPVTQWVFTRPAAGGA
jgi:precorrin-6Y C5,15-methyltransferase (decarboxylating)